MHTHCTLLIACFFRNTFAFKYSQYFSAQFNFCCTIQCLYTHACMLALSYIHALKYCVLTTLFHSVCARSAPLPDATHVECLMFSAPCFQTQLTPVISRVAHGVLLVFITPPAYHVLSFLLNHSKCPRPHRQARITSALLSRHFTLHANLPENSYLIFTPTHSLIWAPFAAAQFHCSCTHTACTRSLNAAPVIHRLHNPYTRWHRTIRTHSNWYLSRIHPHDSLIWYTRYFPALHHIHR